MRCAVDRTLKRCMFLSGKLKSGGVQVYTAEGLFATNKDSGGSLKIAGAGGICANQHQSQEPEPATMRLANRKTKEEKSRF